jgi:signal transduction histidine kinase/CheY-like chemotaxis protein
MARTVMTPLLTRCLAALVVLTAAAGCGGGDVTTLTRAVFVQSESPTPPPPGTAGEVVTLPDDWERRRPAATGHGWYLIDWTPAGRGDAAIYVTATTMPVAAYVNGRLAGSSGSLTGPRPSSWQRSQLFAVPAEILREGRNHIALRVYEGTPSAGGLGLVLAGAPAEVRARATRDFVLHTLGPAIVSAIIVVLGLFILVLWTRRRDATYGLFGVASVLWGLHSALNLLPQPLLSDPHWGIWRMALYMLFVGLLCLFCLRFAGVHAPRFRDFVIGYTALVPIALYVAYAAGALIAAATLVRLVGLGMGVVALGTVARYALRKRDTESWLLLAAGALAVVLGAHDWLAAQDSQNMRPLWLVPYAALAFLMLLGWILTDRFVRALNEYEALNVTLEARVAQSSEALRHQLHETRAARDAAESADRAKSQFLAAASHDLRQPLHALGLFASRLGDRARDGEDAALVARIQTSVGSLDSLFSALLDISRLEAGAVVAEPRPMPLDPLFERIANDFAPEALDKEIALSVRPTRLAVHSDPVLLERIVRNIVANAVRYTERGGIVVGARVRGDDVAIDVCDTGRGIAADEQERIFEEFYQVGNRQRDRSRGLGLGLAIVRRLALLLDHRIEVRSRPGHGSRFRVLAPRASPPDETRTGNGAGGTFIDPLAGKRVVVIDDDESIREGTRRTLLAWGAHPVVGASAADVLAQLTTRPDALVVDYRLAGVDDGLRAIAHVQSRFNAAIPAIVVSGESAPDRLARLHASGHLLLHKPVPPAKLRAALAAALRGEVTAEPPA